MNAGYLLPEDALQKNTCIVGIGNPLRSDDGVGAYICQLLEEKKLPGVSCITTQQLDIGIAEDLSKYKRVIFVDASLKEETISFQSISSGFHQSNNSSHQVNAGMLANLVQQLYSTDTQFYICAIGATDFEMGNTLSPKARNNAMSAVLLLYEWVKRAD